MNAAMKTFIDTTSGCAVRLLLTEDEQIWACKRDLWELAKARGALYEIPIKALVQVVSKPRDSFYLPRRKLAVVEESWASLGLMFLHYIGWEPFLRLSHVDDPLEIADSLVESVADIDPPAVDRLSELIQRVEALERLYNAMLGFLQGAYAKRQEELEKRIQSLEARPGLKDGGEVALPAFKKLLNQGYAMLKAAEERAS
jgi:hypothetical protein